MKVIAAPGIQVPMEDKPRSYITDAEAVEVPDTVYYLRRIADGDLGYASTTSPAPAHKTNALTTRK